MNEWIIWLVIGHVVIVMYVEVDEMQVDETLAKMNKMEVPPS